MDKVARVSHSGSEKRQRSLKRDMRMTPDELVELEVKANQAGMTVASFMRHQCLGTAGPRAARQPTIERKALAQLLGHLGKCGSNLNQIARAMNVGEPTPGGITEAIAEVRQAAKEIMRALGRGES